MIETKSETNKLYAVRLDELIGHPMMYFLPPKFVKKLNGGMVVTLGENINDVGIAAYFDENELHLIKLMRVRLYKLRGTRFVSVPQG